MKKRVIVVTHDAGGSEIIAAYVKAHSANTDFLVYTNGPGARIFRRQGIAFHRIPDNRSAIRRIFTMTDASSALLALPGWMTSIEITALEEAKRAGLRTAVYLEDWRKYRERFGYPQKAWKERLPDELWAGDPLAYRLAHKLFKGPSVSVRQIPNEYFRNIVMRVRKLRRASRTRGILFVSSAWGNTDLFSDLLKGASEKHIHTPVIIRFHPADSRTRYDALIHQYRGQVTVEKSREKDLAKDLARAELVIGAQTVVLPIAALSGLTAIEVPSRVVAPRSGTRKAWTRGLAPAPLFPGVTKAKDARSALSRQKNLKKV